MLLSLFPTRQVMVAAGATLSTEQSTFVYSLPFFFSVPELMVMSGRAAWEREVKPQEVRGGSVFFFFWKNIKSMVPLHGQICPLLRQNYPSLDLLNIPQRGSVTLLFSGSSNAG